MNVQQEISDYLIHNFSVDNVCRQEDRTALENKYSNILQLTDKFNRRIVSYQANKTEFLHSWLKYKEGFSSALVEEFIKEFGLRPGNLILDPFVGSGTTALVAQRNGIDSVGFDILSISKLAFDSKINAQKYDTEELEKVLDIVKELHFPDSTKNVFNHLPITEGAFPQETEAHILFLKEWIDGSNYSSATKTLASFLIASLLENLSYTSKDGQYLRWDHRSSKVIEANQKRMRGGKAPLKTRLDKGDLPRLKPLFIESLNKVIKEIKEVKEELRKVPQSKHTFILGSVLFELPKCAVERVDCVITSPPYCNRYDYTRTYALELAYLGVDKKQINKMRQDLLTCTVENKPKINELKDFYQTIDASDRFDEVVDAVSKNKALQEVLVALRQRNDRGDINNESVIRMVEGYFTELAFVFREMHRVCRKDARVAIVNDNVRYAGEIVPVDFISTELAEAFGFKPVKVFVLPQTKGNSSQQMKKFGQVRLRKSITVWKK